jgi:hypothetical protein
MMCIGRLTNLEFEELKTDTDTTRELIHQVESEKRNTLKEYHTTEENMSRQLSKWR